MIGYAKVDECGRVLEWSPEQWIVGEDAIEVSNCEIFDELCINGLEDFIVEDGIARFEEIPEHEIEKLKSWLADSDYICAKIAEGSATAEQYADKIAQRRKWRARISELGG